MSPVVWCNFRYNSGSMITWLLLLLAVALFTAVNIIIGCYVAIRLGYGPPDWKTALNLVVPVTALQDSLNAGRDYLEKKAPWADRLLVRWRVPRPIIIVVPTVEKEEDEEIDENGENGEVNDEQADAGVVTDSAITQNGSFSGIAVGEILDKLEPHAPEAEQVPSPDAENTGENR